MLFGAVFGPRARGRDDGRYRPCRWKANAQGYGSIKGMTFQIQNGKHVIVSPAHMAEAKLLLMPKWEDRGKK